MQKQHLQWLQSSEGIRQFLVQNNIPKGSRIALHNMHPNDTISWIWGIARHQSTAVLLSDRDPEPVKKQRCQQVHATYMFSHVPPSAVPKERHPIDPTRIAIILFTSGSTKKPKAVAHSIKSLRTNALASNINIPVTRHDRWLLSLALWHVGGLAIMFRTLYAGATLIPLAKENSLGTQIQKYRITHLSVVSTQLYRLLQENSDTSSLKHILVGGGPIPASFIRAAIKLPIHTTYGMTELGSQLCTTHPKASPTALQTAGKPLAGWTIKIANNKEICAKGPALFLGYAKGTELHTPFDKDGFFHTGDQGHICEDGFLSVIGRCDQMFISGGENIHPEEIEKVLCDLPNIEAALVIGVEHTEYGMRPLAFIKGSISLQKIHEHLQNTLPKFKHPDRFVHWPDILPTQKPSRKKAKAYYEQEAQTLSYFKQ